MDILERPCYQKGASEWVVIKKDILHYHKIPYTISMILECSRRLRECLTPDLLTKKYRVENETNPMYGHCYHATQAMYYLLDTDTLDPMSARDYRGDLHWWLRDRENGFVIDMTADQYYSVGKEPPHNKGKVSKWYGWKQRPHKRTMHLMMKMQQDAIMDSWVADHLAPS